jgi:hemoglobin
MKSQRLKTLAYAAAMIALLGCASPSRAADRTLYDDLGGQDGITKIVDYSMTDYVTDPRISDVFDNINLDWLKARFVLQFCQLTGGPCKYPGRDMGPAHKGLHLNTAQFNAVVEDLQDAMDKAEIPFRTQNRLLALLAPMKLQIVTR